MSRDVVCSEFCSPLLRSLPFLSACVWWRELWHRCVMCSLQSAFKVPDFESFHMHIIVFYQAVSGRVHQQTAQRGSRPLSYLIISVTFVMWVQSSCDEIELPPLPISTTAWSSSEKQQETGRQAGRQEPWGNISNPGCKKRKSERWREKDEMSDGAR